MPITVQDIYSFMERIEENAERSINRRTSDIIAARSDDAVTIHMALGAKHAIESLRRQIQLSDEAEQNRQKYYEARRVAREARKLSKKIPPSKTQSIQEVELETPAKVKA